MNKIVVDKEQVEFTSFDDGEKVKRDVYEMHKTKNLVTGVTIVYPHRQTKGHAHPKRDEHYYIIRGSGYLLLDQEKYEIKAGDDVLVPPTSVHTVVNPNDVPLEFFFAAIPGEPKV